MDMVAESVERAGDGPWELPEGWVWVELGALGSWTGGGTPSKANAAFWTGGTVPWVSPKDMKVDVIGGTEDKITDAAVAGSATKPVAPGSVLMVMRSGILRHSFPIAVNDRTVTLNQDLRALTPGGAVEAAYLARYLACAARTILHECSKDGTTVNSVDADALARFPVPLAPLAEQRRIVARVDALFAEIAEGEAALEAARKGLDIFRRALLKAAVTGELTKDWREKNPVTETGHDLLARIRATRVAKGQAKGRGKRAAAPPLDTAALPELPEGWEWGTLSEIAAAGPANGYSPKKSTDGSGTLALKLTATTQGRIDLSDRAVKHLSETIPADSDLFLKPGDLLFQRGNTIEYVGIAAVYEGPSKTYVYPDLMIRVRLNPAIDTEWVWRVANAPYGRRYMSDRATGTAGTMPKISGEILRSFPIPIPPPAEAAEILRRVAQALSASADTLAMLDAEAADATRLKQSILKAAFEGRLVPQDPADEPASVLLARLKATHSTGGTARRGRGRRS